MKEVREDGNSYVYRRSGSRFGYLQDVVLHDGKECLDNM